MKAVTKSFGLLWARVRPVGRKDRGSSMDPRRYPPTQMTGQMRLNPTRRPVDANEPSIFHFLIQGYLPLPTSIHKHFMGVVMMKAAEEGRMLSPFELTSKLAMFWISSDCYYPPHGKRVG